MNKPTATSQQQLSVPEAHQLLDDLRHLTNAVQEYLPQAAEIVLPYFKNRKREVSRPLVSNMIRYELKALLLEAGIPVTDEEDAEGLTYLSENEKVPMEPIANDGLEGTFKGYRFKILRSDDGQLPTPGYSERKQAFYGQQLALFAVAPGDPPVHLNVVLLWSFDPNYRIPRLYLSVPRQGGKTRRSVKAYYTVPVPNPIDHMTGKRTQPLQAPQELSIGIKENAPITTSKVGTSERKKE